MNIFNKIPEAQMETPIFNIHTFTLLDDWKQLDQRKT